MPTTRPGNRRGRGAPSADGAPSRTERPARRFARRSVLWLTAGLLLAAALGTTAAFLYRPSITSASGAALGPLPRGVGLADLNILFITLDTTRADKLGCYGEPTQVTPNLDRLAAEGVLFERAFSPVPLTLPAHATIFTGTVPPTHGVRDNGGYVLDPTHESLAHVLRRRGGWATGAFVGAFVLDGRWGLDQGFDTYVDDFDLATFKSFSLSDVSRRGGEVVDAALPWLEQHAHQRFFAWLHFYDPHSPYDPPEPFKTQFAQRPYLGEIAYMDAQIGRVFRWLDDHALWNRTLIVAMGDHGESLNEHGEGTHGLFIYDATLRVPLLVRAPFGALTPRRVSSLVRSQDVMPTLLDLLQVQVPSGVQGRSLVPLMTGQVTDLNLDAYSESFYSRFHFGWSELKGLRAGRYKYIDAPRPELYDLDQDAGETTNLYAQRRPLADRLGAELKRFEPAAGPAPAAPALDAETRERLAALGYIGAAPQTTATPGRTLPDPKDKIDLFNMLINAREGAGPGQSRIVIANLEKVIAADPNIVDAWMTLGNEHTRREETEQAIRCYKEALQRNPDYEAATISLANAYRRLGRHEEAIAGYERYLQRDPRNGYVHYQLGEVFMDTGRQDRAREEFSRALELDGRLASARNALGAIALQQGDFVTAEREVRDALKLKPDVALAHYNLALLAERRGDRPTAVAEYRREIEMHPDSYKAAFNLAALYGEIGNRAGQQQALARAIEMNPTFAEGYVYLARFYLETNQRFEEAIRLAKRGLELNPRSAFAPLGHYVLADLYARQGRTGESTREGLLGRSLEGRNK